MNDHNLVIVFIEYVGWIEKIIELDDGKFQMVVVVYNWVVANYEMFMTIARHDESSQSNELWTIYPTFYLSLNHLHFQCMSNKYYL